MQLQTSHDSEVGHSNNGGSGDSHDGAWTTTTVCVRVVGLKRHRLIHQLSDAGINKAAQASQKFGCAYAQRCVLQQQNQCHRFKQ